MWGVGPAMARAGGMDEGGSSPLAHIRHRNNTILGDVMLQPMDVAPMHNRH